LKISREQPSDTFGSQVEKSKTWAGKMLKNDYIFNANRGKDCDEYGKKKHVCFFFLFINLICFLIKIILRFCCWVFIVHGFVHLLTEPFGLC